MKLKRFRDWSIAGKILALTMASMVFLACAIWFLVLPQFEKTIWDEKVSATRHVVDVAFSVIQEHALLAQQGALTTEEAKRLAAAKIKLLRYGGSEYFWINDLTPSMIMHPFKPELDGKPLAENKDPKGKHLFIEMVNVCREHGEGFVEYMWPKPGQSEAVPKLSYVKLYTPWGWIVGSGVYVDDVEAELSALRKFVAISLLLAAFIASCAGALIGKQIARPLKDVIHRMEDADLTTLFNSDRLDETGDLARTFDQFVTSIKETLIQVAESSRAVAVSCSQISSSTEKMAAGAQEQSAQATEVSSGVEAMSRTIIGNADKVVGTAKTAQKAKTTAENGGRVVDETLEGMKRIAAVVNRSAVTVKELGHSSNQIGEIIGVIDDIADQTNLLALNAAIEAARAGDQGRGFAVVADEVRKLAERTTKATKEIAAMITRIQKETLGAVGAMEEGTREVERGILLADQAGDSLQEIVHISQEVTEMISLVASTSEQQSSASEQIAKNVQAISAVTVETSAGVQEVALAVEDLKRLSEHLEEMLGHFHMQTGPAAGGQPVKNLQAPRARRVQEQRIGHNSKPYQATQQEYHGSHHLG